MGKIKQRVVSGLLALGILGGGSLAFAAPAQAYTVSERQFVRCPHMMDVYKYYDFDWWEETFQGKRDYYQYIYSYYKYNSACGSYWL